jgi:hypothetical protein
MHDVESVDKQSFTVSQPTIIQRTSCAAENNYKEGEAQQSPSAGTRLQDCMQVAVYIRIL